MDQLFGTPEESSAEEELISDNVPDDWEKCDEILLRRMEKDTKRRIKRMKKKAEEPSNWDIM